MYKREYEYKRILNGKEVTIKVKANKPSQEALKRCAKTILEIMQEIKREQSNLPSLDIKE